MAALPRMPDFRGKSASCHFVFAVPGLADPDILQQADGSMLTAASKRNAGCPVGIDTSGARGDAPRAHRDG